MTDADIWKGLLDIIESSANQERHSQAKEVDLGAQPSQGHSSDHKKNYSDFIYENYSPNFDPRVEIGFNNTKFFDPFTPVPFGSTISPESSKLVASKLLGDIRENTNVLLHGFPGDGKTSVLQSLVNLLDQESIETVLFTTTHVNDVPYTGSCIFSAIFNEDGWFKESVTDANILIIDDVDRLSESMFSLADANARKWRNRPSEPFGGMKVVCSKDPIYLKSVGDSEYTIVRWRDMQFRAHSIRDYVQILGGNSLLSKNENELFAGSCEGLKDSVESGANATRPTVDFVPSKDHQEKIRFMEVKTPPVQGELDL